MVSTQPTLDESFAADTVSREADDAEIVERSAEHQFDRQAFICAAEHDAERQGLRLPASVAPISR
jgi:hypothetical protein